MISLKSFSSALLIIYTPLKKPGSSPAWLFLGWHVKTYFTDWTSPKTINSIRTVTMPPFLTEQLRAYLRQIYDIQAWSRLFPFTRSKLRTAMGKACKASGVKHIRIRNIRHSHVSLLIEMGFPPLLIAKRIGDTVEMVNNIYGHLYPNKHKNVATALHSLIVSK